MEAVYNGINFTKELLREFETGEKLELVRAKERQLRAARQARALGATSRTPLGRRQLMIDPWLYHYWGRREGYQIWSDEKEVARFVKDSPEIGVEQEKRARVPGWQQPEKAPPTILDQFGRAAGTA